MQPEEVKKLIEDELADVEAQVSGDGSHYEAIVVGDIFAGKSMVEQQRMVYGPLNEYILKVFGSRLRFECIEYLVLIILETSSRRPLLLHSLEADQSCVSITIKINRETEPFCVCTLNWSNKYPSR